MKLKSGEAVVDRHRSHLHPGVAVLLPEALARVESRGQSFFVEEVDFGRPIGETNRVPTEPGDTIVYAQRLGRHGPSRFVKNRKSAPCSSVVVILKAGDCGDFVLITAFVGTRPEPEPWDRNAIRSSDDLARAVAFWGSQALVWGLESIVPGTETLVCPW